MANQYFVMEKMFEQDVYKITFSFSFFYGLPYKIFGEAKCYYSSKLTFWSSSPQDYQLRRSGSPAKILVVLQNYRKILRIFNPHLRISLDKQSPTQDHISGFLGLSNLVRDENAEGNKKNKIMYRGLDECSQQNPAGCTGGALSPLENFDFQML